MVTSLLRHVGVVADTAVTEHIWGLLGDQDPDLVHRATELQVAQVETRGELFSTVLVECHQVLQHTHTHTFTVGVGMEQRQENLAWHASSPGW